MDYQRFYQYLLSHVETLVSVILIAVIGLLAISYLRKLLLYYLNRKVSDPTLHKLLINALSTVMLVLLLIMVLGKLGVQTASLITVLGAATVAIGLALKDSLANVAAGLLLVTLQPFKVGDTIEAAGTIGSVKDINLFNTLLLTANNEAIVIPNNKLLNDKIINKTYRLMRRIDISIGIGYEADIDKAKSIVMQVLQADKRVLENPEPAVVVNQLGDSAVELRIRPWVKKSDYSQTRFDLLQTIKQAFDVNQISIPYPQMDVRVLQQQ